MALNRNIWTGVLHQNDAELIMNTIPKEVSKPEDRKLQLVWGNIVFFAYLHAVALYGLWLIITAAKVGTTIFNVFTYFMGELGITAGAHRLWCHRSYKAKWPLRLFLIFCNTLLFEGSVIDWARDHRVHHKFTDTDADPYNSKRGLFFSHIGWLLCRKHPQIKEKGKQIDISDLWADPILRYQKKYYAILMPLICILIPTLIPVYFWNETWGNAFIINICRYTVALNTTMLVNSVAHKYGTKPYDKYSSSSENPLLAFFAIGEGFHNYHHSFPWDYKTGELGKYSTNFSAAVIDLFAKIGWAYDLKSVSNEVVKKRVERTGDGTRHIWGWGDKDMPKEVYSDVMITHRKDL